MMKNKIFLSTMGAVGAFFIAWGVYGGVVDPHIQTSVTSDTELAAASALTDNFTTPTTAPVGSFNMVYDGSTWDFLRGDSTNGALVNLGSNNDITVDGSVAHDSPDSGAPVKIGGKAATAKPSAVQNNDRVNAYFDEYGRLHTLDESGSAVLPSNYTSPFDYSVAFTTSTTITISGSPITIDDANCTVTYVMHKPAAGTWQNPYINGFNGVSLIAANNVITIAGAGTPFASGDAYRVGSRCQDKAYESAGNNLRTAEVNPLNQQVVEESLIDTTNVAASQQYYPSSLGMAMMGYKNFSITGKYIDGDATTTTFIIQATNDEDATNADWSNIQCQIQGLSGTVTGTVAGSSGITLNPGTIMTTFVTAAAQTTTFAIDCDNMNYRYVRWAVLPGDATNTLIGKARRQY